MKTILFCEFDGLGEKQIEKVLSNFGYNVVTYKRKCENYDTDKSYYDSLLAMIDSEKPQYVFSINYLPIVAKVCRVYRILYISWIYDSPELHLYSSSVKSPYNRIFLFDKLQYERFHHVNPESFFYMPLATEPMSLQDMDSITAKEREQYNADVVFIGSLYNETNKNFHDIKKLNPYIKGWIESVANSQSLVQGYNFIEDALTDELVESIKTGLQYELIDDYEGADKEIIADIYIGSYASYKDRVCTLQKIAKKYPLTIYTGSDTSELNGVINKGIAYTDSMMPKIFNQAKININITSKTIRSGIPLRVFDVLGSRGFLITNYQPELLDYFEPGKDLVIYNSHDELDELIGYYLKHDNARENIAEHGWNTVRENYTYEKMISLIFEFVKNKIS